MVGICVQWFGLSLLSLEGGGGSKHTRLLVAGGGKTKRKTLKEQKLPNRLDSHKSITICDWGNWIYGGSSVKLDNEIDSLVGGAKAPKTIKTYAGCFKKWAHFGDLQNKSFLIEPQEDKKASETDLLRFATLQFGPLQKSAATVALYFTAIEYVHKVQIGYNPWENMPRV